MSVKGLLDEFVLASRECLGEKLLGVYLHGSLSMGCFHPVKSDIDLLCVVNAPLTYEEKEKYILEIIRLNESAPEKGIEMSVVLDIHMKPFVHPAPYEMHFSCAHLENYKRDLKGTLSSLHGTDRDLAAHVTIINNYGKVLFGRATEDVFSVVSHKDYLDALIYDIENAKEDILENPVYTSLSLCRVLAYVKDGKILSKKDGALWAIKNVDKEHAPVAESALYAYLTGEDIGIEKQAAGEFAGYMLKRIKNLMNG